MDDRNPAPTAPAAARPRGWVARSLDLVERVGNRLPDPAVLFLLLMVSAWLISWALSGVSFGEIDPRSGKPVEIRNLLAGESITAFMAAMVGTFTSFPPLGVVLVAMLGLGVAEHTGFINAVLRAAMGALKPVETIGTAPGAALNNVVLIPLAVLVVLSITTIRPRPSSAASSD